MGTTNLQWMIGLVRNPTVYAAESETKIKGIAHDLALRKIEKMSEPFRRNNLPVKRTKRLLDFFRVVINFRVAPATLDEQLMNAAIRVLPSEELRALFSPLLEDLEFSRNWLDS